jgi:diguanylate cyclase (GGDEF)-like protein/putative nucleotidyltransferase with HDIG domain
LGSPDEFEWLKWLLEIGRRVNAAETLDDVLDVVYDGIRDGLDYDRVGIVLFDWDREEFVECRGTDEHGEKTCPTERVLSLKPDSPIWRSPDLAALKEGAYCYYTDDLYRDTPPDQRYLLDGRPTHNLAVGLRSGERMTGLISVDNFVSRRPITPEQAPLLLALGNQVGTAVERARVLEEATRRAECDPLTRLLNHRTIMEYLSIGLTMPQPFSLLLIDLNDLKLFNDTYGHLVGDAVLTQVAGILREMCREDDRAARYGGDEFAVVLCGASREDGMRVKHRLREAVRASPYVGAAGEIIPISVSIGVACYPDEGTSYQELIAAADADMYADKRGGRRPNGFTVATVSPDTGLHALPLNLEVFGDNPLDVLQGLVDAVDATDRYTREHSQDVARLALLLADELALDEAQRRVLALAGALHDIGKIAIPARVLRKPGRLTAEEYDVVKRHVPYGVAIIRGVLDDEAVVEAVACHHERWDGTGYPTSLRGEHTKLPARIVQLADAASAMRLDRPYRSALSEHLLVAQLRAGAGTQFDPELVEHLVRALRRLSGHVKTA